MSLPPNKNLLKEFPNPVYVETGIWRGDSIQLAIDAGFNDIIGIDNDPESIAFCMNRFADQPEDLVYLRKGDSATDLWDVIQNISNPITFYLDAHWQLLEGTEKGPHPFPLIAELGQIDRHHIKTHTIIIDDILYLTHPDITGWSLELIKDCIHSINPDYRIKLIANPVIDNMLIAWIP